MKKVLFVSYFFAPDNEIAAIRTTKLAKYLHLECGYDVDVVTAERERGVIDENLQQDIRYINQINRVLAPNFSNKIRGIFGINNGEKGPSSNHTKVSLFKKILRFSIQSVGYIIHLMENGCYYLRAVRKLKTMELSDYKVVISSYGPHSSHYIGKFIKKRNPQIFWVADFRDPPYRNFEKQSIFKFYNINFAKKICANANIITGVSQGTLDGLYFDKFEKLRVVTNGYDKEDIINIKGALQKKFTLTYTGTLYNGKSDVTPVFRAIRECLDEGLMDLDKVQIVYAGRSQNQFLYQIEQYALLPCFQAKGLLSRDESLQLQMESSILLMAVWNDPDSNGIISGKFFEYLMLEKPIVCIVSGSLPNSELSKMFTIAEVGFCYEEALAEAQYRDLKLYLIDQYNRACSGQALYFEPNQSYIDEFSYVNIAKNLEKLWLS